MSEETTTIRITGSRAIEAARVADTLLSKFAEPNSSAMVGLSVPDARALTVSMLYTDIEVTKSEVDALWSEVACASIHPSDFDPLFSWRGGFISRELADDIVDVAILGQRGPEGEAALDAATRISDEALVQIKRIGDLILDASYPAEDGSLEFSLTSVQVSELDDLIAQASSAQAVIARKILLHKSTECGQ